MSGRFLCALAATLVVAAAGRPAPADDGGAAEFGNDRFHAAILSDAPLPDADDFAAVLLRGERLTVSVTADRGSSLLPRVTLVGPGGGEISPSLASKKGGSSVVLSSFAAPATGTWRVRVAGTAADEGAYTAAFKIAAAPPLRSRARVPVSTVVEFEGADGALLDLKLSWKDKAAPVYIDSIEGPDGSPSVGGTARATKKSLALRGVSLVGGAGTYRARFTSPSADAGFAYELRVRPQGRAGGSRPHELSAHEPYLDAVSEPVRGIAGSIVELHGKNLGVADLAQVLFAGIPAAATPSADGTKTTVIVPSGVLEGTTVDVSLAGADGQCSTRTAYFRYVPTPTITDLVNASGVPVRSGPAAGGAALVLRGTNFEPTQTVRFGTATAVVSEVTNAGQMKIVTPAATGVVRVFVMDEFGRTVQSVFTYANQ